jgi:outer membrane protein TolC
MAVTKQLATAFETSTMAVSNKLTTAFVNFGMQKNKVHLAAGSCLVAIAAFFPLSAFAQPSADQNAPQLKAPINNFTPAPDDKVQQSETSAVDAYDRFGKSNDNAAAKRELEAIEAETQEAAGSIFQTPEKIEVKAPLLKALIMLDSTMSPYDLDAKTARGITLGESVQVALKNNLLIQISEAEVGMKKWNWISTIGNFLPSLQSETSFQGIKGNYISPAGLSIPIDSGYLNMNSGFSQYLYKGGSILHGALEANHQYKAARYGLHGTVNDVLLEATRKYYDLVLNNVLLQIRLKAVEVSKGLVLVNEDLLHEGVNTQLDLLQSKYQLSQDRQDLIAQQVERRESAVKLATALNIDSGEDLTLKDRLVNKIRLIDRTLRPADLLIVAVKNRPELQRHEQLRLAALEQIKVARAPLLPAVTYTGAVTGTGAAIRSLSPSASSSSGSTPLATTGGGAAGIGPVSSGGGGLPLSSGQTSSSGRHWQTRSLFVMGVDVQWTLGGLGLTQASKVQEAKYYARREQLEFNQSLNKIYEQVRDAYLSSMSAETLVSETTDAVKYATEGLRVAELRFKEGIGTYLDVLNAQRDYIRSLTAKAKAIIKFNTSQAELLYAIGRISTETVTSQVPFKG